MWKGIRELDEYLTIFHPQIAVMITQFWVFELFYKLLI